MPMDETLGVVAVDFGGRSAAVVDTKVRTRLVGDLQTELVADFFDGFSRGAKANVHAKVHLRPLEPSQDRSAVQSVRARVASSLLERQATGTHAAQHEGTPVIAIIDYGAGNLTSVVKALAASGARVRGDHRRRHRVGCGDS